VLAALPTGVAVQMDNLRKIYSTKRFGVFGRGKPVVAIEDLTFSVPKVRHFVSERSLLIICRVRSSACSVATVQPSLPAFPR